MSLFGSRWALSEDSGFKSYPSRPEVYLVTKKRGAIDNNYGIRLQDSAFLSEVAVKSPEEGQREFGRNVVKEETTHTKKKKKKTKKKKHYQDEGEKSAINR